MYLIGCDIGTQGTKSVLVNERGEVLLEAQREYDVIKPGSNWAEQWPDVWAKAAFDTIREVAEKADVTKKEIAGLAISGLYGGSGIPVDREMKPLHPCLIWMDRRATAQTSWVKENIPEEKIFSII